MAAASLKQTVSRKQLDYSRNRKFCGLSSALLVTSLCLLLLGSVFFLDLEILYRKTGFNPLPPGDGALAQGLASSELDPTVEVANSITDDGDGVAGELEVPVEEEAEPTASDAETEPAVSDAMVEPIDPETETDLAVSNAEKVTTAEDLAVSDPETVITAEDEPATDVKVETTAEDKPAVSDAVVEPIDPETETETEPAVSDAEKVTTAEDLAVSDPETVTTAEDEPATDAKAETTAEEEPAVSDAETVTTAEEEPAVSDAEKVTAAEDLAVSDPETVTTAEDEPATDAKLRISAEEAPAVAGAKTETSAEEEPAVAGAEAETAGEEEAEPEEVRVPALTIEMPRALKGCDITQGQWVYDSASHPLYRSKNCPFADPGFRCQENGRPDTEFMSYRWQPHGCDLPRFNARDILERLRGLRFVFVGDSLGRNNWESMLCMLAEGVSDKSRIYEVNGEPITKHSGKLIYRFEDYNCTVEYYREPFLVPQTRPPQHSPKNVTYTIVVDHVSWSTEMWINADIIIFNVGHWWSEHKIFRKGCKFQEFGKLQDYDLVSGFRRALHTWATYLNKHLDSNKSEVFWISFPTVHFRGGTWNSGGHCHQEKRPLTKEEAEKEWQSPWMNQVVLDSFIPKLKPIRHAVTYLDITTATNYRSDGHGGLYNWDTKKFGLKPLNHQDCSHFCLPGVPDTWNELILASLFAKGEHPWAIASPQ